MKDYGVGSFNAFLLALIVYMALVFFIAFKLSEEAKQSVKYTDIANSFVDVELGEYQATPAQNTQSNPEKQAKIEEEQLKETTNKAVETKEDTQKASDISSLFGNVKDYQEEQSSKVQSSSKSQSKTTTTSTSASNIVKQLNDSLINQSDKIGQSSQKQMTGVYDEFLGKIARRMQENWLLYPRSGNFSVIVHFFIDSNGIFGYTSVSKSGNAEFDAKVELFLEDLKGKFIAYPPNSKRYEDTASISDEISMQQH
ncbi:energy transducer TonB [Campylobacter sp. MIT 12-8780]|uniref:TonB C-terminal domain-containing protein n=1 Tax=unclassified Campylobacter TaxID=2593542 RepID=UPI0010FA283D|nr:MULTISPECIES: TonB C-terminal domain-containing protein [unclassified Campylobacter]NDJ27372.1 TonB C-terminal domain-containing protein [Campylobacter sp. MIT 19-121]TKX28498.1 energy transducer TonB [Campylobacter sp. MIT 12-5580]TQR40236.1 energy transducer TonB [Campylobacter sp. MIT 12-8780]